MFILRLKHSWMLLFTGLLIFFGYSSAAFAVWEQPAHTFGFSSIESLKIVSDANGKAINLVINDAAWAEAYYFSEGFWSKSPTLTVSANFSAIDVAMEDSGTALVVWNDAGVGYTSYFDGLVWNSIPTSPFGALTDISIAMNGPGSGVAVWTDDATIYASFFLAGTWSATVNIGSGNLAPKAAFSVNGMVIAGWNSGSIVTGNAYVGGGWLLATSLEAIGVIRSVGVDANGNGLILFENSGQFIISGYFNGSIWIFPVPVSVNDGSSSSLSMGANGVAVAIWIDGTSGTGYSSTFNGASWNEPFEFTAENLITDPSISVNNLGNAVIVYGTVTPQVKSVKKAFGAGWTPAEILQANPPLNGLEFTKSSLSANGLGIAAWISREAITADKYTYAAVSLPPKPPVSFYGNFCKNKFISLSNPVNVVHWRASPSVDVVAYKLRRNSILIATILATSPFVYCDHCHCKHVENVYTLTAVDSGGVEGEPAVIVLN